MIAAAVALLLAATPYTSTTGFTDQFGDSLKDGKVVEVHVSGRDTFDGDTGAEDGRRTFDAMSYEFLFPARLVRDQSGRFDVRGRFRAHAGGTNRGVTSWMFTPAS